MSIMKLLALFAVQLLASPWAAALNGQASIDLSALNGSPQHYASGFLYGIPDTPNQIPDYFYTDMGFNYCRAGGSQTPGYGWSQSLSAYKSRFASALSNYQTTRKYGGRFQLLLNDLWGADGTQNNNNFVWPGDNNDWSNYDGFLTQIISDLNANNMIAGLEIDLWNEPEWVGPFWNRPQSQWLAMYGYGYKKFRQFLPGNLLVGPSLAHGPDPNDTWWTSFLDYINANNAIPDQYTWHLELGTTDPNNDLQTGVNNLNPMLSARGLPTRQININEYGNQDEQFPSGAAWYISRLERYNAYGLRGNWRGGSQLHDFMANLVGKPDLTNPTATGYYPNGEYQVYKYYNTWMVGTRLQTTPSSDGLFDIFSVVASDKVRILSGVRHATGTWNIVINNLSAMNLPTSGSLDITCYAFRWSGQYTEVDADVELNVFTVNYSGNTLSFPVFQTDTTSAFAFEFLRGTGAACPPRPPPPPANCVPKWGQCGGIGYSGSTCCVSSTCTVGNPWYSQCL